MDGTTWEEFAGCVQRFREVVDASFQRKNGTVFDYAILFNFSVCMRVLLEILVDPTQQEDAVDLLGALANLDLKGVDKGQLVLAGQLYLGLRYYHEQFGMDEVIRNSDIARASNMCVLLENIVRQKVPKANAW